MADKDRKILYIKIGITFVIALIIVTTIFIVINFVNDKKGIYKKLPLTSTNTELEQEKPVSNLTDIVNKNRNRPYPLILNDDRGKVVKYNVYFNMGDKPLVCVARNILSTVNDVFGIENKNSPETNYFNTYILKIPINRIAIASTFNGFDRSYMYFDLNDEQRNRLYNEIMSSSRVPGGINLGKTNGYICLLNDKYKYDIINEDLIIDVSKPNIKLGKAEFRNKTADKLGTITYTENSNNFIYKEAVDIKYLISY